MDNMPSLRLATAFILLGYPCVSVAEIWNCGGTYSDRKLDGQECLPIGSTKVCGSDGNSYYVPARGNMTDSSGACAPVSGQPRSPFVVISQDPQPTRLPRKGKQKPSESEEPSAGSLKGAKIPLDLGKLGLGNIAIPDNVLECVTKAVERGEPPEKCADLLLESIKK